MHVYSKSISLFIFGTGLSLGTSALATTVAFNTPKASPGSCSAYQLCAYQGVMSVGRSPAGFYGFVTRSDKPCVALLFDQRLYARAKTGAYVRVEGVGLPRLAVADGVVSTPYFDRILVEGSCGSQPLVLYVTAVRHVR